MLVFGSERYGAQRTLLDGSIQPSEVVKLITVLYIADWLASKGDRLHDWGYGLIPFGVIIGLITGMILLQPDFGTAITIVLTAGAMLFMAGIDWKQMLFAMVVALVSIDRHDVDRRRTRANGWINTCWACKIPRRPASRCGRCGWRCGWAASSAWGWATA